MSLVVLCSVGRGAEETDEGVAAWPGSVRSHHAGLDGRNMRRQLNGQVHPRVLHGVPGTRPSRSMNEGINE